MESEQGQKHTAESSPSQGILTELLGPVSVTEFLERNYLKLPFARPEGCGHLTHLGSWSTLERLLSQPGVDVVAGREGRMREGTPPRCGAEAREALNEGFTLGIRHAERHDPGLAELAERFRHAFAAAIDIHFYCTPAGSPGFGWHYDAEDVFVLQTEGGKEWWLRKNTVNPWPVVEALPADMRYQREIMPVMRCFLKTGDWLYIPAGYWHRTEAGEESLSLSVGVSSATALDVVDFLRSQLPSSLLWRQRLPTPGEASHLTPTERLARYRELFRELGQDLARQMGEESLAQAFLDDRQRPADR